MASLTLRASDRFPAGTSVGAYPESQWAVHLRPPAGAPLGAATESASMGSNGEASYSALADYTAYWFGASVGGTWRYVRGATGDAAAGTATVDVSDEAGRALGVVTLGAGNANVGDVDVASLPADPLGANADAAVAAGAAGSLSAKLRNATALLDALLTELGQKLEPGGEVALNAATLAALESIQIATLPSASAVVTQDASGVDVTTSTTVVIASEAARKGLLIVNTGTAGVTLTLGATAVAKSGIWLAPNGGSWDGLLGSAIWTGSVNGISDSGTNTCTVVSV